MKKKLISLALAIVLVLGVFLTVNAQKKDNSIADPGGTKPPLIANNR